MARVVLIGGRKRRKNKKIQNKQQQIFIQTSNGSSREPVFKHHTKRCLAQTHFGEDAREEEERVREREREKDNLFK